MSFPKMLAIFAVLLFGIIATAALIKNFRSKPVPVLKSQITLVLDEEVHMVPVPEPVKQLVENSYEQPEIVLPQADRINELFNTMGTRLPVIQTVVYKSHVPWQKGRPAWLSDYASHFSTSRHFIARSLNGKPDYFRQNVAEGDRFNVWNPDKQISFYLVIDTSRSKMWFYYLDQTTNERVLLKTYPVGIGRVDGAKASGFLTPLGKYLLGEKIAIYKPKVIGTYGGKKMEMVRVFGTRWIPFDKEIGSCTAPAAGFGIHGVPWVPNEKGELIPNNASLGKYESDGCIRLATSDMEELFSIVISRSTTVELVKDFHQAVLPGEESVLNH